MKPALREAEHAQRQKDIRDEIEAIRRLPEQCEGKDSQAIMVMILDLIHREIGPDEFGDMTPQAQAAKTVSLESMEDYRKLVMKEEDEAAVIFRQTIDQAKRTLPPGARLCIELKDGQMRAWAESADGTVHDVKPTMPAIESQIEMVARWCAEHEPEDEDDEGEGE